VNAISYRGSAKENGKWMKFLTRGSEDKAGTPSHSTIIRWMKRIGCYLLTTSLESISDMVAIIDTFISVGKEKCLVILGISSQKYLEVRQWGVIFLPFYL
jgi:hypothetical protein